MEACWSILLLLAPVFVGGSQESECPNQWSDYKSSCYRVFEHTSSVPSKTWEDSQTYCQSFAGDLVSIESSEENNFVKGLLSSLRARSYWIGLLRNSSSQIATVGWVWPDGAELKSNYKNWAWNEPNNWDNKEKCGEMYKSVGTWNDINCAFSRSFICELPKGTIVPTLTVPTAVSTTSPRADVTCEMGWKGFRKSCYKITSVKRSWSLAKTDCANLGGHLLKIDDQAEQNYFFNQVKGMPHSRFWIGLNDPHGNGNWEWESDRSPLNFTNWHQHEPNGKGTEKCVEMYGDRLAAKWNDHYCYTRAQYICEKEWKSACPDSWTLWGDSCYQFNLAENQLKSWTAARDACQSIGDFSSLVSIHNETEQDFLTKQIASVAKSAVWIGIHDLKAESVHKWSDNSEVDYTKWLNDRTNRDWKDCSVLLGMRTDGAWSMQSCGESHRYICKRNKAMFKCDAPLGMENGNIQDEQISAKNFRNVSSGPTKSRLRSDGKWCPKSMGDYLQIDLGNVYTITNVAVQGLATSYCIHYGHDGKMFKPYGQSRVSECEELISEASDNPHALKGLRKFVGRYIRITPTKGDDTCLRLELYGCLSESRSNPEFRLAAWKKIPSTSIKYQINLNQLSWTDARSYCMEQGAELLSMSTQTIAEYMSNQMNRITSWPLWIGLSQRDDPVTNTFYWNDGSPVNFVAWGYYTPRVVSLSYGCVEYRKTRSTWKAVNCNERKGFVCMKKEPAYPEVAESKVENGATGVWMSSATHYWPLSTVDNGKISGTVSGKTFGNIKVIPGVKDKPDSALEFKKSGMYIDVPLTKQECLTFPDVCPSKQLTLTFMASFDTNAASWNKVVILDSLGGDGKNSTGISVYVENKQLWFVVSYVHILWKIGVSIQGDSVWRHYAMTTRKDRIQVFINGKMVNLQSSVPSYRKQINSKDLKKNLHIGLQSNSKVTSGAVGLTMLGFWNSILPQQDIKAIYTTEFGWCPNGWTAFGMSCYQFSSGRTSWTAGRAQCQALGGDLITISSPVEQAMITSRVQTNSWIGLSEKETAPRRTTRSPWGYRRYTYRRYAYRRYSRKYKLNFSWASSLPAVYTNWQSHVRFAFRYFRTCVSVLLGSGTWSQLTCEASQGAICEKRKDEKKPAVNSTVVNSPKFMRVCQYSSTTLSCPGGSLIRINSGFWGRKDRKVCRYRSITDCGLKTTGQVTKVLRNLCDGSSTCKVKATSNNNFYGANPCNGVFKYLEVNYTCVLKEDLKKLPCPQGWIRGQHNRGVACYRIFQSKKSWSEAEKACERHGNGAKLISIGDKPEQVLATSLMERAWNTDVWIGLSDKNSPNTYTWSDGSPVTWANWAVGNPRGSSTGDHCVYMNLERTTKDLMYWRTANCSQEKLFMCKKILSTPATATPKKTEGGCTSGWTKYNDHCYKYLSWGNTWLSARQSCRRLGRYPTYADLASITSKGENDFITNLANNTVWIGLTGKGVFRGHVWADGTAVSYANWDVGQPDSYNGREACVQQYAETGHWADINCLTKRAYVCKRKTAPITPVNPTVTAPTLGQSSRCKTGWIFFDEKCYYISDDKNSSDYKTWLKADESCRNNGGQLASITSTEEQNFLIKRTRGKRVYSFWIGLHDMSGESLYKWTDGTSYGKFVYWGNNEPNNYHGQEDCVAMTRSNGKWNDNHCSTKKPYICKGLTDGRVLVSVVKPATKVGKDGYCKPGWVANGQFCYEFHTDETDYKTWRDAKNACEEGKNSSSVGELVSITNEFEQAFITMHLKGAKAPLWIGLNNFHLYRSYYWSDNSQSDYFNWNNGQPSWYWSRCVEISPNKNDAGKWSARLCSQRNGYICKTAVLSNPPTGSTTVIVPTKETPSFTCPKEYTQYDKSCYMFVNSAQTFDKAVEYCRKQDAKLMCIASRFEQALLVFLLERNLGSVWTGLSHEPWSAFKYTDHTVPLYTFWGAGQPNLPLDQRACVQANMTGVNVGRWDDVDCNTKNPFICELDYGEPKITLEENSTCDTANGWLKYRKHCYRYYSSYASWPAARYICQRNGGDLISIADDQEMDFTVFSFHNKPRNRLWIGLHDRSGEAGYEWSDKTPVTYINWLEGQPNDYSQTQNCVVMDNQNGRWLDWTCSSRYSFICKRPLECSSKLPLSAKMITTSSSIAANLSKEQAILDTNGDIYSAWCPDTEAELEPNITINLYKVVKISAITVQGRKVPGRYYESQFFKSFFVHYTADGYTWLTYSRKGMDVIFFGNNNGFNAVTNVFDPPIVASSIAVRPTVIKGKQSCMKLSLQGCDNVCQSALGMSSWIIPKDSITASSAMYPSNAEENARPRLNGWCAKENNVKQWIQVNLGRTTLVTKIITYGDRKDSYVKTYKMQVSADGLEWVYYKEHGGVRVFQGNLHASHPVTHSLSDFLQGQFIRIIPTSWKNKICMRFELFGCIADCDGALIVGTINKVSEVKLTSSDESSHPEYARMDSAKAWCPTGQGHYLEVDFGKRVRLKHIITKGSPVNYGKPRRVVTYTLQKFTDKKTWKLYMVDNSVKHIVSDNIKNSTSESKYSFPGRRNDIIARKIRIYPEKSTEAGICMRIEFLGCLAETEIIPTTATPTQITRVATLRFTKLEWNHNYSDKRSKDFRETSEKIIRSVTSVYEKNSDREESIALREVKVKALRKGSVIADLELTFNPKFSKNENITKPLMDAVKSGKVGDMAVDKDYPVFEEKTEVSHSARTADSGGLSGGTIAGVIIGVLLALLIVVGIGLYWRRRKINYGPKQFNNPILYTTANTDEFDVE